MTTREVMICLEQYSMSQLERFLQLSCILRLGMLGYEWMEHG